MSTKINLLTMNLIMNLYTVFFFIVAVSATYKSSLFFGTRILIPIGMHVLLGQLPTSKSQSLLGHILLPYVYDLLI
jgi:hypothetical protein